ncbi:MAG: winged helix-turn-helix domain-containing protein [Candidatus Omnitrophota bacterium]|nr:winged helix-turn-helix domain-containing protein [Candidatus Omnitrophota bacterium]
MITKIGIVAGDIWHLLDEKDEVALSEVVSYTEKPSELVLMSLGWLAREGHIILKKETDDYRVSLRKKEL